MLDVLPQETENSIAQQTRPAHPRGNMPPRVENQRSTESAAVEDYLEQISHLIEAKGYARVVDIAEKLGVSQASVTNMIRKLDANGLVVYEKYRGTVLTETGKQIGASVRQRHQILSRLLEPFGIEAATIHADVEGMEHHVSRPTLRVLRILTEELEKNPQLLARLKRKFSEAAD
jgi:Mn-dependent DtxR family transcriptional regulator